MKIKIDDIGWYKFSALNKKVYFLGIEKDLKLNNVLLIVNVTTNTVIYQFNKTTLSATIDDNVLTLFYDTSSMSDTDELLVFLEVTDDFLINKGYDSKFSELDTSLSEIIIELKKISTQLSLITGATL